MPEISRFFGIVITMYFNDHEPPHFHARYGGYKAAIRIEDFAVTEGRLPPRILGFVVEWAGLHQAELTREWKLAQTEGPLFRIPPLE